MLQQIAGHLKSQKFEEIAADWDKDVLALVRGLLEIEKNAEYVLQLIPSQQLVQVLKSAETLEHLGLDITVHNYALFSFMIETKTQLGKQYSHFASLVSNSDSEVIHAFLNNVIGDHKKGDQDQASIRNIYRMQKIILVSYYKFFNEKQECSPILKLLQKPAFVELMDINREELGVFKFLASAPPRVPDDIDVLLYIFSYEGRESKIDLSIAHIMVNSMAICMGSPRDSNHIYIRAFDILALARTKGPGSDFHHENWDCGYQLPNGVLPNADIMGNHTGYRLALNALIWAAISWSVLVNEEEGCTACTDFRHFLNYWKTDGVYKGARDRTDNEKIKFYIHHS